MSTQFFSKLSQNLIELLKDDEYYDIAIEVGEDPNVKIFHAHTNILCYRSPYLRRTIATNKKNNDNVLTHIRLPKISPEIFQIILMYIYGGILSLNGQNVSENLELLAVADQLQLQELVDYLQKYLIENKSMWIKQHFELTHRTSFQSSNLLELQQCCTDIMANTPEQVFSSLDFTSLPEKSLVSLIKRDDLQMKEIEVWENVLKWGLAKNQTIVSKPLDKWTDDDFKTIKNTLQHCIPLIRFYSLSPKDFLCKIYPYKKLLDQQLFESLLSSYMNPDSEPSDNNILLPRNIKIDEIIDTKIVNLNIISIIFRWINNVDYNSKYSYLRELYLPYKFKLILRGSRDGFTPTKFHELCDNKSNTITFIKVKGTDEILGGYNPLTWTPSGSYHQTMHSFIFSFKSKCNLKNAILSNVKDIDHTINNRVLNHGIFFGDDLMTWGSNIYNDYDHLYSKKLYYEKKIRDDDKFTIEDYEVFQIITKN
ncbi:uncharacterized protein OCT59_029343 [Rhizophagus irregularis]|uniref:Kelch-like protein 17 n=2 Tax=Rhizophagus irregularis TaxID=588596 RepID=A0A015NEJ4_RHIIW|nr:hypothetical protein RirG_021420 [Rhizophagus irregularis DAOM 197198w]UZO09106.1 hypothetical protein OCT59_029343 [Rhizophagus irregularis]